MTTEIVCPSCGEPFAVEPTGLADEAFECPACGQSVLLPTLGPAPRPQQQRQADAPDTSPPIAATPEPAPPTPPTMTRPARP